VAVRVPVPFAVRAATLAILSASLLGCPKKEEPADAGVVAVEASAPKVTDARDIAVSACFSCHTEEMLAQQRLTREKWTAEVKKMMGWGANLDPGDFDPLVTWLAESYGPDAGAWEPKTITPAEAAAELALEDDGPYAPGDFDRGKTLYVDRCAACHGSDARGHIGVNLVERPILYRAPRLAEIVRRGKGKMLPIKATDAEIADILVFLRHQRLPSAELDSGAAPH
jgi:mono/diheme cytochrome c family protein